MKTRNFGLKSKLGICVLLLSFILLPVSPSISMAEEGSQVAGAGGEAAGGTGAGGGVVTEAEAAGAAAAKSGAGAGMGAKGWAIALAIVAAAVAVGAASVGGDDGGVAPATVTGP